MKKKEDMKKKEKKDKKETISADAEAVADKEVQEEVVDERTDLEKVTEELAVSNEKYLRLYAEFENSKKMWEKQKIECLKFGSFNIMKEFSSVMDDVEAAVATIDIEAHKEYAEGLNMVYSKLMKVLETNGLKAIEAEGKAFDPHVHEALMFEENNELDEHTVVGVIQKGYMFEDKVLRPARVRVSKKPVVS